MYVCKLIIYAHKPFSLQKNLYIAFSQSESAAVFKRIIELPCQRKTSPSCWFEQTFQTLRTRYWTVLCFRRDVRRTHNKNRCVDVATVRKTCIRISVYTASVPVLVCVIINACQLQQKLCYSIIVNKQTPQARPNLLCLCCE